MKHPKDFNMPKERVAVLFGGRSVEHEISVITALQAIQAFDPMRYTIIPVYVTLEGKWFTGDSLLERSFYRSLSTNLEKAQEVILLPQSNIGGLIPIKRGRAALQEPIPIDVYFLTFHGQYGEDGCVQGLLELADAAYTGCGVAASAMAMNKYQCKMFLKAHGIPCLPGIVVRREEVMRNLAGKRKEILSTEGLKAFPLFVKPCNLGSSIGISTVYDIPSLDAALAKVFQYDTEALIEPCVTDLMEINVAVLDGSPPKASVVEIPLPSGSSLTYEDKYMRDRKFSTPRSEGMAGLSRLIDPQELDSVTKRQVIDYALHAFHLMDCSGVSRFDFMFDKKRGELYFNELNSIPGSFGFYLWEKSHPPLLYTDMIHQMIERAKERKAQKLSLQRNLGFKVLV